MYDNPNEWKVGDALFRLIGIGVTSICKYEIVRETPTTFVLNSGEKIRKGNNRAIGQDSLYSGIFYSEKCDYGAALKRKYERISLEKEIRGLPLETFHIDKLKKNFRSFKRMKQGETMQQNESTIVQFDGLTREQVLCALYNASNHKGLGILHYDPKPLNIDEARIVLSKSDYVDYLKGRVIKVELPKDAKEFDARLYDRDCGQGAARAAIERYKKF